MFTKVAVITAIPSTKVKQLALIDVRMMTRKVVLYVIIILLWTPLLEKIFFRRTDSFWVGRLHYISIFHVVYIYKFHS